MHGRRVFQPKGLHPKVKRKFSFFLFLMFFFFLKLGSFQLFVENFVDADVFLKKIESEPISAELTTKFQRQFEKLVILDYIIRNTGKKIRLMIFFMFSKMIYNPM